jgi:sigma54-dependent transcription regulator
MPVHVPLKLKQAIFDYAKANSSEFTLAQIWIFDRAVGADQQAMLLPAIEEKRFLPMDRTKRRRATSN